MNILLVDDDPTILEVLLDIYSASFPRLNATMAPDGAYALHLCWEKKYDLICTDYRMPALDGLEFTQIVRRKEGLNQMTGIVFLSGFIPEFKYKAESYNDVYFIEKPANPERLMRISSIAAKIPMINKVG